MFPELFPVEFTIGWYVRKWDDGDVDIFLVDTLTGSRAKCKNYFRNDYFLYGNSVNLNSKKIRKATQKEVLDILEIEANRRGFKKGCVHTMVNYEGRVKAIGDIFSYISSSKRFYFGGHLIMDNGIWAEVLQKSYTIEEAQKEFGIQIVTHF
jgi:hypothetical protein